MQTSHLGIPHQLTQETLDLREIGTSLEQKLPRLPSLTKGQPSIKVDKFITEENKPSRAKWEDFLNQPKAKPEVFEHNIFTEAQKQKATSIYKDRVQSYR